MFRKLMSSLLRADLEPAVSWSEIETLETVARIAMDMPRWSGKETLEQVLCTSGNDYVLLARRSRSGWLTRVRFSRQLNGREMRVTEWMPGPTPVYRLQLWPADSATVSYVSASPTWFRLWRNESHAELGAGVCFVDSADRELLKGLRHRLLDGKIPESLQNEEELWQRVNSMNAPDRRAAMAALAMQSLGAVDRQFHEAHPDAGSPPEGLKPLFENVQRQIQEIQKTAAARPVDPALADLMQRFVADATTNPSALAPRAETEDESEHDPRD